MGGAAIYMHLAPPEENPGPPVITGPTVVPALPAISGGDKEEPTKVQAPVEIALVNPTQTESCRFLQNQINGLNSRP